jgi:hypothetical protein
MNAVDLFASAPGKKGRRTRRHGLSKTSEYRAWQTMRLRCLVPTNPAYPDYGGRGITVCDRWVDSPENFIADMGMKPTPKHEIDRIDNNRGYEPGNCRWVTRSENDRNRRSTTWVTFDGVQRRLIDLVDEFGVPSDTARYRMQRMGWSAEQTFRTPVRPKAPNGTRSQRTRKTVAVRDEITGQFLRWEAPNPC